MKKTIVTIIFFAMILFARNIDSRIGDSLALVAIRGANSGTYIDTLTGNDAWIEGSTIDNWKGIVLNEAGRVDSLKLNSKGLLTLPPEIANLTYLTYLDLGFNQLTSLTGEIGNCTNLEFIYLNNNQLNDLPTEMNQLVNAKEVDLRWNSLDFSTFEKILPLSNTVYKFEQDSIPLDTSDVNILRLSKIIGGSSNVFTWYRDGRVLEGETSDTLDLQPYAGSTNSYFCKISNTKVPDVELISSSYIHFYAGSKGSYVEDSIALKTIFDSLYLSSDFYPTTSPMSKWKNVHLNSENRVWAFSVSVSIDSRNYLHSSIGKLTGLRSLTLQFFSDSTYPEEFYTLKLSHLTCRGKSKPDLTKLAKMKSLTSIRLVWLDTLANCSALGDLSNLVSIYLDTSSLTSLPITFKNLAKLEKLSIRRTQSLELPPIFSRMTSLDRLDAYWSGLAFLPDDITLTSPSSIDFSGGYLTEDNLTNVQTNWLNSVYPGWKDEQQSLSVSNRDSVALNLLRKMNPQATWNWSESISYKEWDGVHIDPVLNRVTELNISGKNLLALSSSICLLDKLMSLDVSNNNLESIPAIIYKNTFLRSINASGNKLTLLFTDISEAQPSVLLDVSNNYLKEMYLEQPVIDWLSKYDPDWRVNQTTIVPSVLHSGERVKVVVLDKTLFLSLPVSGEVTVDILNLRGQVISSTVHNCIMGGNKILLSDLNAFGIYIARISTPDDRVITQKFSIRR